MQLRNHPALTYRGVRSWPPPWTGRNGHTVKTITGEVGILRAVEMYRAQPQECYLTIEHEGERYTGCLVVEDLVFAQRLFTWLKWVCVGLAVKDIGDFDVSKSPYFA
jgi:hypothetical protein